MSSLAFKALTPLNNLKGRCVVCTKQTYPDQIAHAQMVYAYRLVFSCGSSNIFFLKSPITVHENSRKCTSYIYVTIELWWGIIFLFLFLWSYSATVF